MTQPDSSPLFSLVAAQHQGRAEGIVSICSANPHVLRAAARLAKETGTPLLVEATSNQVNPEGGYTGLTPAQFAAIIRQVVAEHGLPPGQLILGGDHLGPYPWRDQPVDIALDKARRLVVECALAGYTKLHLDASMSCAGDPPDPLPDEVMAQRAAGLCQAAEEAYYQLPAGSPPLCYVIGTEVPPPGGAVQEEAGLQVTAPEDAAQTLQVTHQAFLRFGMEAAWERAIALVVQPGVEYGDTTVHAYDRRAAVLLSRLIEGHAGLVYEAHSTDYQTPQDLRALVEDHFAILKVGPALTFALRQALFALAWMEAEWLGGKPGVQLSRLPEALEEAMLADPPHWQAYYQGDKDALRFARKYSLSDRSRYYWAVPQVQRALERLFKNLEERPAPLSLLSQFMPVQHAKVRQGRLGLHPLAWVDDAVQQVLREYYYACGWAGEG